MLKNCGAAFVLLALFVLGGYAARLEISQQHFSQTPQIQPKQKPEGGVNRAHDATQHENPPHAGPSALPESETEATAAKGTHEGEHGGDEASEFWTVFGRRYKITESLLVLFALLLFLATVALWWATRKLVVGADQTAERQLRAYVFVGQATIKDADTLDPIAEIIIKNSGRTPAYYLTVAACAKQGKFPPGITEFDPTPVNKDSSRFVLAPDGTVVRNTPLKEILNPQNTHNIRMGNAALYVWGEIKYIDAFKRPRYAHFRFMIGGDKGWPSTNLMLVCPEGNDDDESAGLSQPP